MLRRELRKLRRIYPVEACRNKFLLFKLVLFTKCYGTTKKNISRGKLITIIIAIIVILTILLGILIPVGKIVTLGFLHSGPFYIQSLTKTRKTNFSNWCVILKQMCFSLAHLSANQSLDNCHRSTCLAGYTMNRMRRNQNLTMLGAEAIQITEYTNLKQGERRQFRIGVTALDNFLFIFQK